MKNLILALLLLILNINAPVFSQNMTAEDYLFEADEYHLNDRDHLAIRSYKKALDLNPNEARAYFNLGLIYLNKGYNDFAIQNFNKYISLNPNSISAYNNIGVAYALKGYYSKAIETYKQVLKLKPDYGKAYYNLGAVYLRAGESRIIAYRYFNRARDLGYNNAYVYRLDGRHYLHTNNVQQDRNLALASEINPNIK